MLSVQLAHVVHRAVLLVNGCHQGFNRRSEVSLLPLPALSGAGRTRQGCLGPQGKRIGETCPVHVHAKTALTEPARQSRSWQLSGAWTRVVRTLRQVAKLTTKPRISNLPLLAGGPFADVAILKGPDC